MWRVVWLVGEVASGKSTLLHKFVSAHGGGSGYVITIQYKTQRYVFSEIGRHGSRVFVLGPANAYTNHDVRPGIDSGSTPFRASFHIAVAKLLQTSPAGTLILDVSSYPMSGLETLGTFADVYALFMPRASTETLRKRYYERQKKDPRYYSRTYEQNHKMVTRTLNKVRDWLSEHAVREVQLTAPNMLYTLKSLVLRRQSPSPRRSRKGRFSESRGQLSR